MVNELKTEECKRRKNISSLSRQENCYCKYLKNHQSYQNYHICVRYKSFLIDLVLTNLLHLIPFKSCKSLSCQKSRFSKISQIPYQKYRQTAQCFDGIFVSFKSASNLAVKVKKKKKKKKNGFSCVFLHTPLLSTFFLCNSCLNNAQGTIIDLKKYY